MKFTVEEIGGRAMAYFPDESSPKDWLLSFFLEDSRTDIQMCLEEIRKAEKREVVPSGFTGNHVDIEFYPDRAIIEELYPEDEDNFRSIEISLTDVKQLLLDWKKTLNEWEKT
jgi:hypothetical protein